MDRKQEQPDGHSEGGTGTAELEERRRSRRPPPSPVNCLEWPASPGPCGAGLGIGIGGPRRVAPGTDLAADVARRRISHRPELTDRSHLGRRRPVDGGRRPRRQSLGIPPGQRHAGTGVARPHRGCPHRLDSVGHSRRFRHGHRLRGGRQCRPSPGRRVLRLRQFRIRGVGPERPGPQRPLRRAGVHGGGKSQRGELGGRAVTGPGGVRLQCLQRFIVARMAVLHCRQQFHHAVTGRSLRQWADRGGRGRRLIARVGLRRDLLRGRPSACARCRRQSDLRLRHQPDGRLFSGGGQLPGRRPDRHRLRHRVVLPGGLGLQHAVRFGLPLQHRVAHQPRREHGGQSGARRHRG